MKSKRRVRRRFSPEDKARMAAEAHRRRAAGETWEAITEDLDVLVNSLRLWMRQNPPKPKKRRPKKPPRPKLAEVKVIEPSPPTTKSDLVLTTASGHQLSGLSLDTAAALLERLR